MTRHLPESLLLRGVGLPGGEADLADLRRERWTGQAAPAVAVLPAVETILAMAAWERRRCKKKAAAA